jgi:colanic acid/amylovoran biosynthesis glycosyltransferase
VTTALSSCQHDDGFLKQIWDIPPAPWALHSTPLLGNLTERWIEVQLAASRRYPPRLMGMEIAEQAARQQHWLVVRDRRDLLMAYKGMFKSGGVSPVWLVTEFQGDRRPSVMHVHYGPPAAQLRHLARVLRTPLVASFYGYDATKAKYRESWLWRGRYRRLFRDAAVLIAEGPAMAARLQALGCPSEKVHVVRLPADARSLERCMRPKAEVFRAVIAGRFAEKKGFDVGIRAFARALRGRSDAELLMIGGGELEANYRRLVRETGIASQVRWAGRLPFDAFMSRVSTAHVGLFPSRTAHNGDSEGGAPVTLIEAQWLGVPAIVSDHDDLPFVAAPGASVVLQPRAIDDWAAALLSLYQDPARTAAMGNQARTFAEAEHSPEANARRRELLYDSASDHGS